LAIYAAATKPFGRAQVLPPTAYRSKIFADLEDEKVWTRTWVCVGSEQQIPDPGDLLPFTVGNHGIHVQRLTDGSLIGRFNKAQHGGCRAIPAQCQTGTKTKCSFTSCGYSRDREVIHAAEIEEGARLAGQYLGDRPERLLSVKVETWGPFIFVNLDHEAEPLAKQLKDLPKRIGPPIESDVTLATQERTEHACNWKLVGRAVLEDLALPLGAGIGPNGGRAATPMRGATPSHTLVGRTLGNDYAERFSSLPELAGLKASQRETLRLFWLFPNLLLALAPDHVTSVILQPTATAMTRLRMALFVSSIAKPAAIATDLADLTSAWLEALAESAAEAESRQRDFDTWDLPSRRQAAKKRLPKENSCYGYDFQKFLVERILAEHKYYWAAPLYSRPGR
jgi:hypothetical protein